MDEEKDQEKREKTVCVCVGGGSRMKQTDMLGLQLLHR